MEMIQRIKDVFMAHKLLAALLVVFVVLLVGCLVLRAPLLSAQKGKENGVREEGFTNSKPTVCLHYVNWCPHCTKVKPHFETLLSDSEVTAAANVKLIDCEGEGKETCEKKEIGSFPTITCTDSSGKEVEYEGPRDVESLKNLCLNGL